MTWARAPAGLASGPRTLNDGADAEGAADGHDGLHGRMQAGRVQEGEAVAAQGMRPRRRG